MKTETSEVIHLIERFCKFLTCKIRKKMPDINDERAEVIDYGLQLVIGEIPKTLIILLIAHICGVLKLSIIALITIMPYRMFSGGVHLKTHIGCILATSFFYTGNAVISKIVVFNPIYIKYIAIILIWVFSIAMIKLYAPADTEDVPILREKERKLKKILSYITMTLTLIYSVLIGNPILSNIAILGVFIQTIFISRLAYKLTHNKYGYEEYYKNKVIEKIA